ncbi:MAG: hypothetical protein ACK5YO_05450, partial [Planctomyces sp.]
FQQQDPDTPALLHQLLRQSPVPQARLQALNTLAAATPATPAEIRQDTPPLTKHLNDAVLHLLADPHPHLRRHALRIAAEHSLAALPDAVARSIREDSDPAVLFEAALHLHRLNIPRQENLLTNLLARSPADPWIRTA